MSRMGFAPATTWAIVIVAVTLALTGLWIVEHLKSKGAARRSEGGFKKAA
jgi:hypothetical protein